jgi:hypothetical protein
VSHPLEGARSLEYASWDEVAMRDLFGDRPVFLFDPNDDSNRPVAGLHDNALIYWGLYPQFLRDRFVQAFTAGIRDPEDRVQESVWRASMARLRDAVIYCQHCGRQNLFDDDAPHRNCWSCGVVVVPPPRLRFGRTVVALNYDTALYAHHLLRNYDFDTKVAEMCEHPQQAGVWGLRNVGSESWHVVAPEGNSYDLPPGRTVPLLDKLEIDFRRTRGVVEA